MLPGHLGSRRQLSPARESQTDSALTQPSTDTDQTRVSSVVPGPPLHFLLAPSLKYRSHFRQGNSSVFLIKFTLPRKESRCLSSYFFSSTHLQAQGKLTLYVLNKPCLNGPTTSDCLLCPEWLSFHLFPLKSCSLFQAQVKCSPSSLLMKLSLIFQAKVNLTLLCVNVHCLNFCHSISAFCHIL